MTAPVSVRGLQIDFASAHGSVRAVDGIDLDIARGEIVAIVGESGAGKSAAARSLVGLVGAGATVQADRFELFDEDVRGISEKRWRAIRGAAIGFVSQDALVSLDPLRTVGQEIAEVLRTHRIGTRADRVARVGQLLADVGVPLPSLRRRQRPSELSGGLRQRALIASAIAAGPAMLIGDEPTTALDATVQAQVLDLLRARRDCGETLLLISHDLAVVASLADRIHVMRQGRIVDTLSPRELSRSTVSYTRQLLRAVPSPDRKGMRLSDDTPHRASEPLGEPVLEVRHALKRFASPGRGIQTAVADVTFALRRGEILGVVGESGSGKSTVARLALGLDTPDSGEVLLDGAPWNGPRFAERGRRDRRGSVQLISQDPLSSFDPRYTVAQIVDESMFGLGWSGRARTERMRELITAVGLEEGHLRRRPHQLSGGQRQRVAIARALAPRPRVLIADEAVSALDVSIQAQILDLLLDLRAREQLSILFISHDLGVVHHVSDRVLVMKDGAIVEHGTPQDVLTRPSHAYTRRLVDSLPAPASTPIPAQRAPQ